MIPTATATPALPGALALAGVTCTFADKSDRSQRYTAVRDVTLSVADGEFVSVVGPTGCGKSTLLNVAAGLEFHRVADASAQALEWLKRVGLGAFGDRYPHQLSGGMRKRVSLSQTLVLDPDIILMDEPFSALDIQTRQLMENEVLDLWAAKKKAVCSSRTTSTRRSR